MSDSGSQSLVCKPQNTGLWSVSRTVSFNFQIPGLSNVCDPALNNSTARDYMHWHILFIAHQDFQQSLYFNTNVLPYLSPLSLDIYKYTNHTSNHYH